MTISPKMVLRKNKEKNSKKCVTENNLIKLKLKKSFELIVLATILIIFGLSLNLHNYAVNSSATPKTTTTQNESAGVAKDNSIKVSTINWRNQIKNRQYGYKLKANNQNIEKIVIYKNNGTLVDYSSSMYSLKSLTNSQNLNNQNINNFVRNYNITYDFDDKAKLVPSIFENDTNYYATKWILDNAYIPYYSTSNKELSKDQNNKISDAQNVKKELLANAGIAEDTQKDLTDDDVEIVQQLAIWYFTNTKLTENSSIYHQDGADGTPTMQEISLAEKDFKIYKSMQEVNSNRFQSMEKLFKYLVTNAKAPQNIESYKANKSLAGDPISINQTTNPSISVEGGNYIIGPYKIDKNNDLDFEFTPIFENQDGQELTGYKVLDSNKKETTKNIKSLIGTPFYVSFPVNNIGKTTKLTFKYTGSYNTTIKTYLTNSSNEGTQEPIVAISKDLKQIKDGIDVSFSNKEFDLSLRKFINSVNDTNLNREPQPDISNLNKLVEGGRVTTATYNHTKTTVVLKQGDVVTYTMRIYNEGQVDGYAGEITDYLPPELEFINDTKNYPQETDFNASQGWKIDSTGRVIKTNKLAYSPEAADSDQNSNNLIKAYGGNYLDYKDVKVKLKVRTSAKAQSKITNIAQITAETDSQGQPVVDRDSTPNGGFTLPQDQDLANYKDNEINQSFVPGQQDDDDFEKVIIEVFDLSLRKFITGTNGTQIIGREPTVDVSNLKSGSDTTATYTHSKEPIDVKRGNTIEYTIRVYNEGSIDGYANEIADYIPEELEFMQDSEINKKYGWEASNNGRTLKTRYLSRTVNSGATNSETTNSSTANTGTINSGTVNSAVAGNSNNANSANAQNLLRAFDGNTLDYRDVKLELKVKENAEFKKKLTNIAEITSQSDKDGNEMVDRDSDPGHIQIPSDNDLQNYKEDEINKTYVPGQQDDDDFEKVRIIYFDLALREFITATNDTQIINRVPNLAVDEKGDISYSHTKDPVMVENQDVVTYTIRIYNEGLEGGYASKIKEDIPEGLKFLPDNAINKQYKWEETEDGRGIVTDYLSKEQEKNVGDNLLKPFESSQGLSDINPNYKEIKVAFKVTEPNSEDRIIKTTAEILEDRDSSNKPVQDIDSTVNNNNELNKEDDLDQEFIKVKKFDLSLKKWVSKTIIKDKNGKTTEKETGRNGDEKTESPIKIDIGRNEINDSSIKIEYQIKVTNEGEIAGYAKEISDYIPDGLKFVQEENQNWYAREALNGRVRVGNKSLENTLIQPGESKTISIILDWDNDSDNMGTKTNIAEISKDYTDSDTPDIDSTPDNFKEGEDDISSAPVLIAIKLGDTKLYIGILALIVIILGGGIYIVKKYFM